DYYEILGLEKRWLSTPDDIRKAYKKKVKEYHPDHFKKTGENGETTSGDDTMFKALTRAYETLLDERKKLCYDSSEPFDDSIPTYSAPSTPLTEEEEQKRFFSTFAPVFERWSKWSRSFPNVPKLGDMKTSFEELERFYVFWSTFKSWRDFSGESEYDESTADSREERRWMKRQNDKINQKRKKEEKKKLTDLVELARKNDPRVKKKNEEIEQERKRKEEEKNKRELERILREEKERKEEEERIKKVEQEEREKKQKEKEENERKQQEKTQTIKRMREMCDPYLLLLMKPVKKQDKMTNIRPEDVEFKQQTQEQKKNEKQKTSEWNHEELSLLAKAISMFPGGTPQRWIKVAEYVKTKTPEEVQQKTGEIQEEKKMDEQYNINNQTNNVDSSSSGTENWTALQQKALETGIRQFKELKGDSKWEKISEIVPGKSAKDCKERFEYCRQLALAKKNNK
ncbi:predicted protein, partial [Naegleria gruberi]